MMTSQDDISTLFSLYLQILSESSGTPVELLYFLYLAMCFSMYLILVLTFFSAIYYWIFYPLLQLPIAMKGKIELFSDHSKDLKTNHVTSVNNLIFLHDSGKKSFFSKMFFKKQLWEKEKDISVAQGIFFANQNSLFRNILNIWGVTHLVFLKNLGKPGIFWYLVLIFLNILMAVYFPRNILWSISFILLCLAHYLRRKRLFNRRLQLLDKWGIQRPEGC